MFLFNMIVTIWVTVDFLSTLICRTILLFRQHGCLLDVFFVCLFHRTFWGNTRDCCQWKSHEFRHFLKYSFGTNHAHGQSAWWYFPHSDVICEHYLSILTCFCLNFTHSTAVPWLADWFLVWMSRGQVFLLKWTVSVSEMFLIFWECFLIWRECKELCVCVVQV